MKLATGSRVTSKRASSKIGRISLAGIVFDCQTEIGFGQHVIDDSRSLARCQSPDKGKGIRVIRRFSKKKEKSLDIRSNYHLKSLRVDL